MQAYTLHYKLLVIILFFCVVRQLSRFWNLWR